MSRHCMLVLACLAAGLGCEGPGPGERPLSLGSFEEFEAQVQPHLTERCASGGCHGRPDRPLALFAPGAYRVDPRRTYLDEPLQPSELEENMRRISAFALEPIAVETLVVQKPLSVDAGGVWHGGGEVFVDTVDPGCLALSRWLDARLSSADGGMP